MEIDFAGRVGLRGLLLTLAIAAAILGVHSADASFAVLAGGLVALINFRLSSKTLKKIITTEINPAIVKGLSYLSFLFRYLLLAAVLYVAIKSGIHPFYFLIGLSSVVGAAFLSYSDLKRETV